MKKTVDCYKNINYITRRHGWIFLKNSNYKKFDSIIRKYAMRGNSITYSRKIVRSFVEKLNVG